MLESKLERRLRREIYARGGKALKLVSPGTAGVPDRLILLPGGKVLFVEVKASGKALSPLQQKRAAELRALGFQVYRMDSAAALDDILQEVFP